jgi:hypothetical protein
MNPAQADKADKAAKVDKADKVDKVDKAAKVDKVRGHHGPTSGAGRPPTAREIPAAGLVPIVEPEVNIHSPDKAAAEEQLTPSIIDHLGTLNEGQHAGRRDR